MQPSVATVAYGRRHRPRLGRKGQPRGHGYRLQGRSLAGAAACRGRAAAHSNGVQRYCPPRGGGGDVVKAKRARASF
ncbi:hypothetical protein BHE74_00008332 [Ensete ventricosum]|nr:hypothetical protein BHE74_00008332 [Ensete ventricosum]RZS16282.1 hypothetical protein BHM03_00048254 [Ensete ventricosum]